MSAAEESGLESLSWVLEGLAVGGRLTEAQMKWVAHRWGIRRVVDLRREDKDDEVLLNQYGITVLHLPTEDLCAISREMLWQGVRWVNAQLDQGEAVYVHCQYGIGRSALLAGCVLVSQGHSPRSALETLKSVRRIISPSPAQLEALLAWSAEWHLRMNRPEPPDDLSQLCDIAYAHLSESG